jgi:uncharacterized protein (DUF342 family)
MVGFSDWENKVVIEVSENHLQAFITLVETPQDDWSFDRLVAYVLQKGVRYRLDEEAIRQLVSNSESLKNNPWQIAQGIAPKPGEDGYIRFIYEKKDQAGPATLADGSVDYYNIRTLDNIKSHQVIAECMPPTEAVAGTSVYGEPIQGKNGIPARFKIGKNVYVNEEGTKLLSSIDGLVSTTDGGKINVFAIYEVPGDVDFHIGNIDFVGTVIVRGSVLPGFKIKANGDIRVMGNVEAADLTSDGKIEVLSGIIGLHKCTIQAGTDVRTSYMHNAKIIAKGNVFVQQSIMHCEVKAGKSVFCNSDRGLIVGGLVLAGESVVARNIGNPTSTPTLIEVGIMPEMREEWGQLRHQMKEHQESKTKTEQVIQLLGQVLKATGVLPPEKRELYEKCKSTLSHLDVQIEELQQKIWVLEESMKQEKSSFVSVSGTIYNSVKLILGHKIYPVMDSFSRAKFIILDDHVAPVPL